MRHALPASLVVGLLAILACGGAGTPAERPAPEAPSEPAAATPTGEPVPIRMVGSSAWTWPREDLSGTAVLAADEDAATVWTPADGETAVFFVAGAPSAVQVEGQAPGRVRLWTKGKKRWVPDVGPWMELDDDGSAALAADARILGVEVEPGGPVHTVRVRGEPATSRSRTWELSLTAAVDGEHFVDWHDATIGEIDLERCEVRKPMAGPGEAFEGDCEATASGLTLRGEVHGAGKVDATLPIVDVGPCLKLVGGWPYTMCQ